MTDSRLRTLRDHIRWAVSRFHASELFFGHGTDNAWDEARQLVLGALHLPWEIADSYLDCRLEDDERVRLLHLLKRRIEDRVPTAYLLGEAWFCGMSFIVDERVLVPRSPIGELLEKRFEPWLAQEPARILDLCTGSGCIGIVAADVFPEAEVVLADLSFEALEVANQNIERHGLEERVYTVQGDGFAGLPGQRFDLIVSNPPYVDADAMAWLHSLHGSMGTGYISGHIRMPPTYVSGAIISIPPVKPCRRRRHFSPRMRINRFVFLNLPALQPRGPSWRNGFASIPFTCGLRHPAS